MFLHPRSRFFVRHDMCLRPHYGHGTPLSLQSGDERLDIVTVLQRAVDRDQAKVVLRNKDVVRLTKVEPRPKDGMVVLLFRRSDPDATTPVFENQKTRKLKPVEKDDDDAIAVSAHVFISTETTGGLRPRYATIFEEVPGLGRTYIQTILADVLKDVKYGYKDQRGETKETHTLIDFEGVKSESLKSALEGGVIPYVELVKPADVSGLDTSDIVPREMKMKIYIRAEPEKAIPIINKIKKWSGTANWSGFKVRIDMPEHRSRLVSIAREQDAADVLFVRATLVEVENDLQACTAVVNDELVAKAKAIFAA